MRTSVFEILRSRLDGARVADLFAGSGSLGLEALSRGAARAVFLDTDSRCLEVIRRNLGKLRFEDRGEVLRASAFEAAAGLAPADLAFVDPPYAFYRDRAAEMRRLVETLLERVVQSPEGRVIAEHSDGRGLDGVAGGTVVDERRYGGTVVTFYARG
jgi:16S rRNA (guanine966-N2)-methyltransferase